MTPSAAALPTQFLHEPRAAPPSELRAAKVEMGTTCSLPMVEHTAARARALAAYAGARSGERERALKLSRPGAGIPDVG